MSLRKSWQERLHGALLPAVPVPFRRDGHLDAAAQGRYVAYMAEQAPAGVAVWAHTGRGLHLSPQQRSAVLAAWRQGLGPEPIIVCGVGSGATGDAADPAFRRRYVDETLGMAEQALSGGADAIMTYAPAAYRGGAQQDTWVLEYHERLAALGAPVILFYLYEAAGGITYSPSLLQALFRIPQVVAIKMATLDSVMTFQDVAALLDSRFPDVTLITGEDRFLGYSLMCGAQGALVGMGASCVGLQKSLVDAWIRRDCATFVALNTRADALAQVIFRAPMEGYIRRELMALALQGVIPGESAWDPWGPAVPQEEEAQIRAVLAAIGELPTGKHP